MEEKGGIYDLSGEYELLTDEVPCSVDTPPMVYPLSMQLPGTTAQQGIGTYNEAGESGFFTEKYPFAGQIWLRRVIAISKEQACKKHCFLTLERTRMTEVWVNGQRIGSENSLCTPHVYDLSEHLAERMELVIRVKNVDYPTRGGHMTSPDTQTNWIGITGRMELRFYDEVYLDGLRAFPNAKSRKVVLKGCLHGTSGLRLQIMASWPSSNIDFIQAGSQAQEQAKKEIASEGVWRELGAFEIKAEDEAGDFALEVSLPEDAPLWSEHNPRCITLDMVFAGAARITFGLRDFKACGDHFEINGHPTFLRGKHDGMVFPITGAAPTTKKAWARVFGIMKDWGINHYRFHTCCPPEAAFAAADDAGIYMEPELPFWGTIDAPGGEKYDGAEQAYLIREGLRICQSFGNHPSFCMLSLGNELWGDPEHIGSIIQILRDADPRPLYTQGSNNFQFAPIQLPQEDFWTGVRTGIGSLIRGSYADCDKPLGRIQTEAPSASWNYEEYLAPEWKRADFQSPAGNAMGENGSKTLRKTLATDAEEGEIEIQFGTGVKKVKAAGKKGGFVPSIPAVTHEIGQYNVYPDYREIEGYTGVLEARNFEIFRERLEKAGMGDQAEEFFRCSGAFSRELYKMELEAAMRSPHLAGFQILDLQDFPGQGTALVGMLNARLENKGFVSPEQWRGFCGDLVPLAVFDSYVWTEGKPVKVGIALRSSRPFLKAQKLEIIYSGHREYVHQSMKELQEAERVQAAEYTAEFTVPENANGYVELGEVHIIPSCQGKAELILRIPGENVENSWQITVFPEAEPILESDHAGRGRREHRTMTDKVLVTASRTEAEESLKKGGRVLLLTGKLRDTKSIRGFYCTDFWNYHMFNSISLSMGRQVPVGTMGLCMDEAHPVMRAMYSESYSTPQWYEPVTRSDCAILDDMPAGYRPILQMIDNVDRNHRLGLLYEAKVAEGSLMVCTIRFEEAPENPAMRRLYRVILDYMASDAFSPKIRANWEQLGLS